MVLALWVGYAVGVLLPGARSQRKRRPLRRSALPRHSRTARDALQRIA